jgi:hypothetical protein
MAWPVSITSKSDPAWDESWVGVACRERNSSTGVKNKKCCSSRFIETDLSPYTQQQL